MSDGSNIEGREAIARSFIKVEYRNIPPGGSILQIDGQKLGEALLEMGYSNRILQKRVVIDGGSSSLGGGHYNVYKGRVTIWTGDIEKGLRDLYSIFQNHGDNEGLVTTDNDVVVLGNVRGKTRKRTDVGQWWLESRKMIKAVLDSELVYKLNPLFLGHTLAGAGNPESAFVGNSERFWNYVETLRGGKAVWGGTERSNLEGEERLRRFMGGQIERIMRRYFAQAVAHEFEHSRGTVLKFLPVAVMATASYLLGMGLAAEINWRGFSNNWIQLAVYLGLPLSAGFLGGSVGNIIAEQASYKAERSFNKLIDSVKINPEVFEKNVLGKMSIDR